MPAGCDWRWKVEYHRGAARMFFMPCAWAIDVDPGGTNGHDQTHGREQPRGRHSR
jgi:hypothetical protein